MGSGSEKVVLGWVLLSLDKLVVGKQLVASAAGGLWALSNKHHAKAWMLISGLGPPGLWERNSHKG